MSVATCTPARTARTHTLRRVSVPATDPPYDDELDALLPAAAPRRAHDGAQGSLALVFAAGTPRPAPLRLVRPGVDPDAQDGPERRSEARRTDPLPAPGPVAAQLLQAVLEVLAGHRSAQQLSRHASGEVLDLLQSAAAAEATRRSPGSRLDHSSRVRSVRVSCPGQAVAEVCGVVQRGRRVGAIALRLDGTSGHWRCTALQLG